MSSIIEGYNYDIFISYRQKDNKGERWVSEFVDALRTELESTFKEDISIYFDENPHDGLLETHDVDASLKEKLKCLIFIPVISRTYCDPKAFAWEHEFRAFVEIASNDKFGLKVTLPNGNVATRVLPVRIHELDREDIELCESLLGGVLRGVDFIYKSPGVNRPLRANEDHPQYNLNKTYYRDQINKVANAINDIILSVKRCRSNTAPHDQESKLKSNKKVIRLKDQFVRVLHPKRLKRIIIILFSFLIFLLAGYFTFSKLHPYNKEKALALIPLQNAFKDTSLINPASEYLEAIYQKLIDVKSITTIPGFLTDRYIENEKSNFKLRKKVNYFLSGNIRKKNGEITIWIELSREDKIIANKSITWRNDLMPKNTSEIVRFIANKMEVALTPGEEKQIDTELSADPNVNLNLLEANKDLNNAWDYYNYGDKLLDSASFKTAIESYDNIIKEDPNSGLAYAKRAIARSWGLYLEQLDSSNIKKCKEDIEKAISIDRKLSEVEVAQGFYYYYCLDQNEKALEHFEKASIMEPGNYKPLFYMALAERRLGRWKECHEHLQKITRLIPHEALFLTNIGLTYSFLHDFDTAIIYQQKSIDMIPEWTVGYKNKFDALILKKGVTSETRELIDEVIKKTGDKMIKYRILLMMYQKKFSEAFSLADSSDTEDFEFPGEKYLFMAKLCRALNNYTSAAKYFEAARLILSQAVIKNPESSLLHGVLGLSYAGLGKKTKALEEADIAIQISDKKNKVDESDMKMYLAQINTMLGDYDDAFPRIQFLLNNPSYFSKKLLVLDPVWKPLLDRPVYKKLLR